MKKLMMTVLLLPMMALADIDNILVSRLEPWEGKVKIEYRIVGEIDVSDGMVLQAMTLNDHKSGKSYPVLSVDRCPTFEEGVHSLIWDAWADGCDIESSEVSISIAIKKGSPEYCIINLSGGQDAEEYPMSFLDEIPDGGWTSLYKTVNEENVLSGRIYDPAGTLSIPIPKCALAASTYPGFREWEGYDLPELVGTVVLPPVKVGEGDEGDVVVDLADKYEDETHWTYNWTAPMTVWASFDLEGQYMIRVPTIDKYRDGGWSGSTGNWSNDFNMPMSGPVTAEDIEKRW